MILVPATSLCDANYGTSISVFVPQVISVQAISRVQGTVWLKVRWVSTEGNVNPVLLRGNASEPPDGRKLLFARCSSALLVCAGGVNVTSSLSQHHEGDRWGTITEPFLQTLRNTGPTDKEYIQERTLLDLAQNTPNSCFGILNSRWLTTAVDEEGRHVHVTQRRKRMMTMTMMVVMWHLYGASLGHSMLSQHARCQREKNKTPSQWHGSATSFGRLIKLAGPRVNRQLPLARARCRG